MPVAVIPGHSRNANEPGTTTLSYLWRSKASSGRAAAALHDLELDAAVEGVAGIVPTRSDDHLAGSLAGRDQPPAQGSLLAFEPVLDVIGTIGNVWEWTADCFADDYSAAPSDGAARTSKAARRGPCAAVTGSQAHPCCGPPFAPRPILIPITTILDSGWFERWRTKVRQRAIAALMPRRSVTLRAPGVRWSSTERLPFLVQT